jgi:hypothetical protein
MMTDVDRYSSCEESRYDTYLLVSFIFNTFFGYCVD